MSSSGGGSGALLPLVKGTTSVPVVFPSGANPLAIVMGNAGAGYTAYTQLVALNALASHMLSAMLWYLDVGSTGDGYFIVDVAVGGVGAEVVIGTFGLKWQYTAVGVYQGPVLPYVLPHDLLITANGRVAIRESTIGNLGGFNLNLNGQFYPRTLV